MTRRTTLTLDEDVARKLREQARKDGRPFRAIVNDALRRGLKGTGGGTSDHLRSNDEARSEVLAGDAELSHHGVQCRPVQSETGGGSRDHPAAFPQHSHNMIPLDLLERGAGSGVRGILPYFG